MAAGLIDDNPPAAELLAEPEAAGLAPLRRFAPIAAITLSCLGFYLYHALVEQARYLTTGYDLGIFDQAVRAYAHFKAPIIALKGADYNIFGDHFHPIIAVLAPLYWIWDDPGMLLIAQAVLTAAAIPVVYRFTRRRASEPMSLLVAAAFGFGWPIQGLIDFDFHEIAFATPFVALAIDALDRRDDRRLLLWCGLLLLVREDMGLIVTLIGVLVMAQRHGKVRQAFALIAVGVGTFLVTTTIVIPHFAAGHAFAYGDQFGSLGSSMSAAIMNILTHPWHAANVFFTPDVKTSTMAWLILPFALLPLRSPYSVLVLPLLAQRFFNSRHNLWITTFHYNALPWLILLLAMVDGGDRLGLFDVTRRAARLRHGLAFMLAGLPLLLIVVGPAVTIVPFTSLRGAYAHQPSDWVTNADRVVAWLPTDVCIAADNHLVPHLTARDYTSVPLAGTPDPDFIAIDMIAPDTGGNPPAPSPNEVYAQALSDGYRVVLRAGTFVVFQSPNYAGPSSQCAPLGSGKLR
ncbi:MAG: DUF2079 domain-containing protein [Actinomycetota bacterium]|nr:DUF2079 domain-containing protein [Actinomycetota bacterium]